MSSQGASHHSFRRGNSWRSAIDHHTMLCMHTRTARVNPVVSCRVLFLLCVCVFDLLLCRVNPKQVKGYNPNNRMHTVVQGASHHPLRRVNYGRPAVSHHHRIKLLCVFTPAPLPVHTYPFAPLYRELLTIPFSVAIFEMPLYPTTTITLLCVLYIHTRTATCSQ